MAEENVEELPLANQMASAPKQNPWVPIAVILVAAPLVTFGVTKFVLAPMITSKQDHAAHGAAHEEEAKSLEELSKMQKHEVKNIIANLEGTLRGRFIKVSFTMEGSNKDFLTVVQANEARVVDTALSTLTTLSLQDVDQPGIMNIVKSTLIERINRALEPGPHVVEKLYFSEFVIQ